MIAAAFRASRKKNVAPLIDFPMSLFVDTSIWWAAADSSDLSNARAKAILKSGEALITSDHILVVPWTLLHHRLQGKAAERFWEGLRSGIALIEAVGLADLEAAWEIGLSWHDQDFSIVDRTSFAVMRRLGTERVASLDSHFAVFRFGPKRRPSFHVVR
jgi:predicted nucleic acid-binding protein